MKRSWFKITAAANGLSATVDILDEIGFWGVTASDFARELKAAGDVTNLLVRVNSPGGSVPDAVAIRSILASHPAKVTIEIVGWAASAASYILTAGDEVRIAKDAFVMVHLPRSWMEGVSDDLRKQADLLDKLTDQLVDTYASFMKRDPVEVREMLSVETWFSAEEAVAAGLAHTVIPAKNVTASFDVRKYSAHLPAAMRLNQEGAMDMDLTEENITAIASKVVEVMEANAAAAATNDEENDAAVAASADAVRAEATQIVDACIIAGHPEKASVYLKEGKSLSDVMADLRKTAGDQTVLNTRNGTTPGGNEPAKELDVAGIYARFNGVKKRR